MECSFGKLSAAMDFFSSLPAKGLKTDAVTYKIMITGLRKRGLFNAPEDLLRNTEKSGCPLNSTLVMSLFRDCWKILIFQYQ